MSDSDLFAPRTVKSRRGGGPKAPLGRDRIVDVTLDLLGTEGLAEVSLRRVAKLLDTGPASLYAYVANLHELHVLVLDRALARVDTASARGLGWRARLDSVLGSYFDVLVSGRGLASLALTVVATGPNALRILEALLAIFAEAGVSRRTAAWASDLVLLYTTSIAAEQSQPRATDDPVATVTRELARVSPEAFPRVHAAREALVAGPGASRFAWALDVLVEGIVRSPAPEPTLPTKAKTKPRRP